MDSPGLVAAIVSGIVSLVAIFVQRMFERRQAAATVVKTAAEASALLKKTDAESQDLIAVASGRLMDRYEKQIVALEERLKAQEVKFENQEKRIVQLEEIARTLVAQLMEAGLVPKVKL